MKKIICSGCKKPISGKIKIDTRKRRLGKKIKQQVNFYDEKCFTKLNIERSWDEHRKKEAARKKTNKG